MNHLYVVQVDTIHDNVHKLPNNLLAVMGYVTGTPDIKWTSSDWNYFYGASKVRVDQSSGLSQFALGQADVADVERGAGTVQEFLAAAYERRTKGLQSTLYISYGSLDNAVLDVDRGGLDKDVRYFVADYNWSAAFSISQLKRNPSWVGVQFANPKYNPHTTIPGGSLTLSEANCDLSVKLADWFTAPSLAGSAWVEGK